MRYAISLPNGGNWSEGRILAELAQIAEDSGWDGVFLEDYLVWQNNQSVSTYDPWIALSAMALRTKNIVLGTQVTPLPRRRPWKLARETVSLDHLSGGRLILGVGIGDAGESVAADISFAHFGETWSAKERAAMLDEGLQILAGLWGGEPFEHSGQYYQVQEVTFLPRPIQRPRIPIWIGGGFPLKGPLERAARWDGACLYRHGTHFMSPEDIRDLRSYIEKRRGSLDGYDIAVGGSPRRSDWEEERDYIRSLAEAGATWWTEYIPPDAGELDTVRQMISRGPLRID